MHFRGGRKKSKLTARKSRFMVRKLCGRSVDGSTLVSKTRRHNSTLCARAERWRKGTSRQTANLKHAGSSPVLSSKIYVLTVLDFRNRLRQLLSFLFRSLPENPSNEPKRVFITDHISSKSFVAGNSERGIARVCDFDAPARYAIWLRSSASQRERPQRDV